MRRPSALAVAFVALLAALLSLGVSACSTDKAPDRGGLMVIVTEDGPLGLDRLRVEISAGATTLKASDLRLPDEATLPTTLGIASNGDPAATVRVSVSGFRGGAPIDRRDAIVEQVPVDRIAALTLVLSARCTAQVFAEGSEAKSRCIDGETCSPASGACVSARVDGATLPTYAEGIENEAGVGDATVSGAPDAGPDGSPVGPGGCTADQKLCGPKCVGRDDPAFGCNIATCAPCSVDSNAIYACGVGACQLTGCQTGYKVCGGKCVATNDPTYGCGPTACDSNACPVLDGGSATLVCQGNACVIGTCGAATKKCGNKCVPTDRNNGCEAAASCVSCTGSEICGGGPPTACTCVPDNVTPCIGKQCGSVTNNCGTLISCGNCTLPETCGGASVQYQCGCTAEPLATTCAAKACGPATNNCGQTVWCPSKCSNLETCGDNNTCIAPPSCLGLGPGQATCGSSSEGCCRNTLVPGGTFLRHNGFDATISSFRLDRYEVTVKRYQAFKYAWVTQGWRPAAGAGKHRHLAGGGLNGAEAGWDTAWVTDSLMAITSSDFDSFLACGSKAAWGGAGDLAMNCVSWWEAFAFCIWDGGFLPSAAEWNYAAAAGSEQRTFPWGSYNCGSSCANSCINGGAGACPSAGVQAVGYTTSSPGKWTQWDLAGNVAELSADRPPSATYSPPTPCDNCADMRSQTNRVAHGGSWDDYYQHVTASFDTFVTARSDKVGFRCARLP